MLRAFAARVQAGEEVEVGVEGIALLLRGLFREATEGGVQELPRGAAELSPTKKPSA